MKDGSLILTYAAPPGQPKPTNLTLPFADRLAQYMTKSMWDNQGQFELTAGLKQISSSVATTEIINAPVPISLFGQVPQTVWIGTTDKKTKLWQGQGRALYYDGGVYEGTKLDSKRHGSGSEKWVSGAEYEGEYQNDMKHGRGTLRYINGDVYIGSWANDERSGEGALTYANGTTYEGSFANDKINGQGTYKWLSGAVYTG